MKFNDNSYIIILEREQGRNLYVICSSEEQTRAKMFEFLSFI